MPLVADLYGTLMVVGFDDGSLKQIMLSKWREGPVAKNLHKTQVSDVKFSKDASKIISASSDDSIILIESKTMKILEKIHILDDSFQTRILLDEASRQLLIGGQFSKLYAYDMDEKEFQENDDTAVGTLDMDLDVQER